MKILKRILCFMLMLTFCWSFSACSGKNDTPPDNSNESEIETPLPETGGEDDEGDESVDDVVEPEVIVPMTLENMYSLAKTLNESFFSDFTESGASDSFDVNILSMKNQFINASDMFEAVKSIENIPYETPIYGEVLTVSDVDSPEQVNKFYMIYMPEDENYYSKLELRVSFAYNGLDSLYTYDYYNLIIETDQLNNTISYTCAIENSTESGTNNSTAKYSVFNIVCELKTPANVRNYKVYSLERTKELTSYSSTVINNTNIVNFSKSEFDGTNKVYMDTTQGEACLRNPSSNEHALVVGLVSDLGQDLDLLQNGVALKRITGLSSALISCITQ